MKLKKRKNDTLHLKTALCSALVCLNRFDDILR
jgi:hypothetical protein